jgi:hypothetical protein
MFGGDQFHPAYNPSVKLLSNQVLVGNDLYIINLDKNIVYVESVDGLTYSKTITFDGSLPMEVVAKVSRMRQLRAN